MANGLLDFLQTPEGQGLLSAAFGGLAGARRGEPINSLGRAGLAGLSGYAGAQERQLQQQQFGMNKELRDLQMQQLRRQAEQEDLRRRVVPTLFQPQVTEPQVSMNNMGLPQIDRPATTTGIPQFNVQRALAAGLDPKDIQAYASLQDIGAPKVYKPGDVVYQNGKPVFSVPKEPDVPSKVREYEYAKANGYKGTFDQFVTLGPSIIAAATAPLRQAQIENIQQENAYNLPPPPKMQPGKAGMPVTVNVNGQVFAFPDQQSANNFKMKAGIK